MPTTTAAPSPEAHHTHDHWGNLPEPQDPWLGNVQTEIRVPDYPGEHPLIQSTAEGMLAEHQIEADAWQGGQVEQAAPYDRDQTTFFGETMIRRLGSIARQTFRANTIANSPEAQRQRTAMERHQAFNRLATATTLQTLANAGDANSRSTLQELQRNHVGVHRHKAKHRR